MATSRAALDDKPTYEIFSKGFTSGVFQFESPGMRDILRRYQPSRLEDLTALNALYRPGPIQGGMIDDFIERKWGRRAVQYDLPELKELLDNTAATQYLEEQGASKVVALNSPSQRESARNVRLTIGRMDQLTTSLLDYVRLKANRMEVVPRPLDDPNAGGPVEAQDFEQSRVAPLDDDALRAEATALRRVLDS